MMLNVAFKVTRADSIVPTYAHMELQGKASGSWDTALLSFVPNTEYL